MTRVARPIARLACLGPLLFAWAACGDGSADAGAVAGTYRVDKEHYKRILLAELQANRGPAFTEMDRGSVSVLVDQIGVVLTLRPDGTWTIAGSLGQEVVDDTGTWTANSDVVSLRYTHERGVPLTKTVTARRMPDGSLLVRPSPGQPGPFRMVRR